MATLHPLVQEIALRGTQTKKEPANTKVHDFTWERKRRNVPFGRKNNWVKALCMTYAGALKFFHSTDDLMWILRREATRTEAKPESRWQSWNSAVEPGEV